MIISRDKKIKMVIPTMLRCKLNKCNYYYVLFQNTYTKEVWIFRMRDILLNLIRNYRLFFNIDLPDEFEKGTYDYYVVNDGDFDFDDLNFNSIKLSETEYVMVEPDSEIETIFSEQIDIINRGIFKYKQDNVKDDTKYTSDITTYKKYNKK